jgi:hypothetical protein
MSDKNILITIDISPPSNGQRSVVVSGAPAGEIPVIKVSTFAQLHPTVNAVWAELAKRAPQVPDLTPPRAAPAAKAKKAKASAVAVVDAEASEAADGTSDVDAEIEPAPTSDQLVADQHASALAPLEQAIEEAQASDTTPSTEVTDVAE